jgi:hypothetical protein
MSNFTQHNYDATFKYNILNVMKNLKDKNIIYSIQYIHDEDTQIDQDGPQSDWYISLLCIEKTEDDYIFHFNHSSNIHAYSYPYFVIVDKFTPFSKKLSDLKHDFDTILNTKLNMNKFITMWENDYYYAFHTGDTDLTSELMNLSVKMIEIEKVYEKKCKIDREIAEKEREKYLQSDEYKKFVQEQEEYKAKQEAEDKQKEDDRLKYCIEKFGEVEGRLWHARL